MNTKSVVNLPGTFLFMRQKRKTIMFILRQWLCSLQPFLIFQNDEVFPIKDRIYCFHSGDFAILYFSQSAVFV